MRLATYTTGNGNELGVVTTDEEVVSISRAAPHLASDMIDLIANWDDRKGNVTEIASAREHVLPLSSLRLLAPVPRPGKLFAIGLNYADHIEESGMDTPENQVWFTKAATSVNGPYDPVQVPKVTQFVDYEVELVAIIGRGGKHIDKADASTHIFGYCVGNDVTERLWQHRTPQWSLGKSFDTHAPFGPWITTADEIENIHALNIACSVNGESRQNSNTEHLVFSIWDQIEHLSQAMTLEPGDIIFTGTPGGIGATMNPPQFLKAGDVVRCEIEKLGVIEATFENEG